MHDHTALGVEAARPGARVTTLFIDTGQVAGTLTVDQALWPAVGRHADVAGKAGAGGHAPNVAALGVTAARVRLAWVDRARGGGSFRCD